MKNFKKELATNITLICVLVFTAVHFIILTLGVFGKLELNTYDGFSFILAYIFIVLCLVLFILSFFISKIRHLYVPQWFRIVFYIAFFLFTNTYYIVGGYRNIISIILFFVYISFLSTVANVSVFYNTQKDDKGRLKTSRNYIVTSIFFYSVGTNAIIELIVSMIKSFAMPEFEFSSLNMAIVELSTMILTTIIICAVFFVSLSKSKKIINGCLIKVNKPQK